MLTGRFSSFLAGIASRGRLFVLALIGIGIMLAVIHAGADRGFTPEAAAAEYMLSNPNDLTVLPATVLAAPAVTCPQQSSCHHTLPLVGLVADAADVLMRGGDRRLIPGPVSATGHRATLDHPPPIA